MPGPGLIVKDTITVKTQGGDCQIQLCFGDITRLQKKDKVDVIFVSAFGDNYDKMPGTVIGALWDNLSLDVAQLAKDKEEDLRMLYSCWWSKPLPSKLPYHRLLCFESRRNRAGRPQELIGHAFRCLVPILKNKDASVITPLLSTGNQGFNTSTMLEGMVQAAVSWVKAGLPIRLLKIVLYSKIDDGKTVFLRGVDDNTLDKFTEMKARYESANLIPEEVTLEYDVYLSYSEKDQQSADQIQARLLEEKPDVRIYSSRQKVDNEVFWQEQMYDVVQKSARVVTVLSPSYLASEDCMEQYNIALCCNRQAHRNILAPFFVETTFLPTYMGLVQYADCRENPETSIAQACSQLVKSLTTTDKVVKLASTDPNHYDVFVSYCHADSEQAAPFVNRLKSLKSGLKIFYDIQELKTGHEWQRTLYHSIDGSSCMIALISPHYLKSAVCMEEYSLAQTKHLSEDKLHLLPVCIADGIESDFAQISHIPMFDACISVYESAVNSICSAVVSWLETGSFDHMSAQLQKDPANRVDIPDLMEKLRLARFQSEYGENYRNATFPPNYNKLKDDEVATEKVNSGQGGGRGEKSGEKDAEAASERQDEVAEEGVAPGEEGEGKDGEKHKGEDPEDQGGAPVQKRKDSNASGGGDSFPQPGNACVGNLPSQDGKSDEENQGEKRELVNVVFSYHETDIKFVYHLHDLIHKFAPSLVMKFEFASDQERLDSLEAADHIVALLSPNYMESPQHVEEFHMGLWRQRVSAVGAPLLLPIQVAILPRRPTYFQLVGYPVNTWDPLWADLLGVKKVNSAEPIDGIRHRIARRDLPKVSPDEVMPMTEVAQILMTSIKTKRTLAKMTELHVRPALVNTAKLQAELDALNGEPPKRLQKYLADVPPAPESRKGSKSCTLM